MGLHVVRLVDAPVDVWAALGQHEDELIRECVLLTVGTQEVRDRLPVRLVTLVDQIFREHSSTRNDIVDQVAAAVERQDEHVTVEVSVPDAVVPAILRAQELFEEIDRFCEDGALMTLPTPESGRRLRRWITAEVVAQVRDGRDPTPASAIHPQHRAAPYAGGPGEGGGGGHG